ncbi:S-layer homology domain-containing protein [Ureibacillus sp. FSL W8-0352]|uniref:S-layer homology domain-containing protein n=1 Tax=Ureibacillus sp. FSL W8-0352 TaxID=2954596 RepID=UPI0030FC53E6
MKKLFISTLALAIATPALVAPIPTDAQKQFTDIPASYQYYQIITEMQDKNIINGYSDGTFKPNQTISRQHAAVLIVRAMKANGIELEKVREFVQPKDLTTKNPYYQEIKLLMEAGLLDTDKNGNINPSKPLTRGEMAKILSVAFNLEPNTDFVFNDVKNTKYEEFVKALYANGVTTGYEDGTFKPNNSLTRAHYAVFMYRAMNAVQNNTTYDKAEIAKKLGLEAATVSRVVDGDTFELVNGSKVRLIGVNTPESTTRTEVFGKEASNYTTSKLEGKTVYLQKDVSETDRYGRLLRLVWMEVPTDVMDENEIRTKMFNADLVLNGYAQPATYAPDVTYSEFFVKFAREARENNRGLWRYGTDGTTTGDDLDDKSTNNNNSNSNNSTNENIKTDFKNCTELREVYPNGVASDHPAYQKKFDRDGDGWACEK